MAEAGAPVFKSSELSSAISYWVRTGREGIVVGPVGGASIGGGGISGGSVSTYLARQQEAARIEAARIEAARIEATRIKEIERKAAEERAKAERIKDQAQRERTLQQIARVRRERIQSAEIRAMTPSQKQDYFRAQSAKSRAFQYPKLKRRGKTLTPEAEALLQREISREEASRKDITIPKTDVGKISFERGTRMDEGYKKDIVVHRPGTIYQVTLRESEREGQTFPIYKTYFSTEDYSSRVATPSESEKLQGYIASKEWELLALAKPKTKISRLYGEYKGRYIKFAAQPFLDETSTKKFFVKGGRVGEFIGGGVMGTIGTKGDVIRTGVIYGATAGAGFVISGGTKLVTVGATKVFGATTGSIFGTGLKIATYGTGAYLTGEYVLTKAEEISLAPTTYEKGRITGRTTLDIGAGLYGFRTGAKGYDMFGGWYKTKGRTFIDIPQGEYPTAPTSKQLEMFQKNYYAELSGRQRVIKLKGYTGIGEELSISQVKRLPIKIDVGTPGAFHTTSKVFWKGAKGGKIIPEVGTSELPGLYASTKISTPFARISGSSSRVLPNLKDIFAPPTDPRIAFLKPKGFRYSPYTTTSPYFIGEQKFTYGFVKPTKSGYADVPGLKTEIEAIFRPGAGKYIFESGKYYTKIEGISVPIDVFRYSPDTATLTGASIKTFTPESYSSYHSPSGISLPISQVYTSTPSPDLMPSKVSSAALSSTIPSSISKPYYSPSSTISKTSKISPPLSSKKITSSYKPSMISSAMPSSVLPKSSMISSLISSRKIPSSYRAPYPYRPPYKPPIRKIALPKPVKLPGQRTGKYEVYGRRFGKFKLIGIGKTEQKAISLGKQFASHTLGATFKIPKSQVLKIPGYRTKKTKGSILFIEPKKKRLKKGTKEIPEIQFFKSIKKKTKKKHLFDF